MTGGSSLYSRRIHEEPGGTALYKMTEGSPLYRAKIDGGWGV